MMNADWQATTVGSLGKIVTGSTPPSKESELFGSDHPFLTPTDMAIDRIRVPTARGISTAGSTRFVKKMIPAGSVAVVCIGSIGKVSMADEATLTNQQVNSIVVDRENHDPHFIYYLMRQLSPVLQSIAGGAATPIVNKSAFAALPVSVPSLATQRRVGAVLAAHDELIENNLRQIGTLEEMAQAVYREWFVNLRFPGHEDTGVVDSDLGPIPDDWAQSSLGEVSVVVMGQSPKSEFYNEKGDGLPFHQGVSDFGSHFPVHRKHCTAGTRLAEAGDTLVSVRAPVGRINVADTQLVIGRGLATVRPRDAMYGFHYRRLRYIFREEDSMGGGTIYKAITKGDLLGIPWLQPPPDIRETFDSVERPIFLLIRNLVRQNANLREARDLLLPLLVSGEIDASDLDIDTGWLAS